MRPRVSVLLPCRNAGQWLDDCLDSLCAQTLEELEIIVVDDGSTDDSLSILQRRAGQDSRLVVLERPATGLVFSLNLAAGRARAPLLARMDADDICHPERLSAQFEFMVLNPAIAACGTGVRLFPDERVGSGYRRYERWLNGLRDPAELIADLLVECPVAHPTLMMRSSVLHGLGGYRDAGWPEDYDLMLRLHAAGMTAANLSDPLVDWRVRPDRHSLRSESYSAAAFRRCKIHFLVTSFLPPDRPVVVWGAGRVGKPLALELKRQGMAVRAFVDLDPRKVDQEIHGARVMAPDRFAETLSGGSSYVLGAVGSPGARQEIRRALNDMGLREIRDYRMCA